MLKIKPSSCSIKAIEKNKPIIDSTKPAVAEPLDSVTGDVTTICCCGCE